MRSFTKADLKQLHLEEEITKKNDSINHIVNLVTKLVIENAKSGSTKTRHEYFTPKPYYHDHYVKTEIESTLKRIFIDSIVNVTTENQTDMIPPGLIVSVDWSE